MITTIYTFEYQTAKHSIFIETLEAEDLKSAIKIAKLRALNILQPKCTKVKMINPLPLTEIIIEPEIKPPK